jgi:hypothetical protein
MTETEGLEEYIADLESRPFQHLRNVPIAGLTAWLRYNEQHDGRNMGPEMMQLLNEYIQLRHRKLNAESKVEENRKRYGILGAAVMGLRCRSDLKIKHKLH